MILERLIENASWHIAFSGKKLKEVDVPQDQRPVLPLKGHLVREKLGEAARNALGGTATCRDHTRTDL